MMNSTFDSGTCESELSNNNDTFRAQVLENCERLLQRKMDGDNFEDRDDTSNSLALLETVFDAILKHVTKNPEHLNLFLSILNHLLKLTNTQGDPNSGNFKWKLVDELLNTVSHLKSQEEATCVFASKLSNVSSASAETIRCCRCSCHSTNQSSPKTSFSSFSPTKIIPIAPPAPPPPPPPLLQSKGALNIDCQEQGQLKPPPFVNSLQTQIKNRLASTEQLLQQRSSMKEQQQRARVTPTATATIPGMNSELTSLSGAVKETVDRIERSSLPQLNLPQPKNRLKPVCWNKVPTAKIFASPENCVWVQAPKLCRKMELDFDALEQLFAMDDKAIHRANASDLSPRSGITSYESLGDLRSCATLRRRESSQMVTLLAHKKSMIVSVFLKQFKGGIDELVRLILTGDNKQIGSDNLQTLKKALPDTEEIEILKNYTGSVTVLGTAEQFYVSLLDIFHFRLRIECMLLRDEFDANTEIYRCSLKLLNDTIDDLRNCQSLHEVLYLLLVAGNYVNQDSNGKAVGFKMSSLSMLSELRTNKSPKTTLLHFVAMEAKRTSQKLLEFPHKLSSSLDAALKVNLDALKMDIGSLGKRLDAAWKQVESCSAEDVVSQFGPFLESSRNVLQSLADELNRTETGRKRLAEFFCEEGNNFKLEECFTQFRTFCRSFAEAVSDNEARRLKEDLEKGNTTKNSSEAKLMKNHGGTEARSASPCRSANKNNSSLTSRYSSLNLNEDVTLKTYIDTDSVSQAPNLQPRIACNTQSPASASGPDYYSDARRMLSSSKKHSQDLLSCLQEATISGFGPPRRPVRSIRKPAASVVTSVDRERPASLALECVVSQNISISSSVVDLTPSRPQRREATKCHKETIVQMNSINNTTSAEKQTNETIASIIPEKITHRRETFLLSGLYRESMFGNRRSYAVMHSPGNGASQLNSSICCNGIGCSFYSRLDELSKQGFKASFSEITENHLKVHRSKGEKAFLR